jgi:hypothetical protein
MLISGFENVVLNRKGIRRTITAAARKTGSIRVVMRVKFSFMFLGPERYAFVSGEITKIHVDVFLPHGFSQIK